VRALGWARDHAGPAAPERSLIVAMPTTPGPDVPPLYLVAEEARALNEILPDPTLLIEDPDIPGQRIPTRRTVMAALAGADIAHFACHADSDPAEPSRSRLVLHDHEADPLTVSALASVSLDRAQLAYLSACQTSRSAAARLTDESIHLTSAFQLIGYPHVIGTLWQIEDSSAARIASAFYARLAAGPRPFATGEAAMALRDVIRATRDAGHVARPLLWAAHLHAGA
jgi:CHAT domain-containing protein